MFKYILKKEFLLIFRNIHALLVLFVMPSLFIIIMSLALKNTYSNTVDVKFKVLVNSDHKNKNIAQFLKSIKTNNFFEITYSENKNTNHSILYKMKYDYIIDISSSYLKDIQRNKDTRINIYSKPEATQQNISLLKGLVNTTISKQVRELLLSQLHVNTSKVKNFDKNIKHKYIFKKNSIQITSVQQSVPAWLIFSMFFILIPISNTFINEKNFGTLKRIKSINVSMFPILLGKLIPYYIINLIQVLFMILLGIYIIPLLGGDSLEIKGSIWSIFILSSALSFSAISFALVIANIAKKSEDATTIGGVSNIILAALGGIMVPKFIMPEKMQMLSEFSPMSWALDSYLDILVNGGTFIDIQNNILRLVIFAIVCFFIAYSLLNKTSNQ